MKHCTLKLTSGTEIVMTQNSRLWCHNKPLWINNVTFWCHNSVVWWYSRALHRYNIAFWWHGVDCDAKIEHLVAPWSMCCHNIALYETIKYYDVTMYHHHHGGMMQHCDDYKAFDGKWSIVMGQGHCDNIITILMAQWSTLITPWGVWWWKATL